MNDDAAALIQAYLDGELTDRQQRELADWLRHNSHNVDRFVAECRLHSELLDARGRQPSASFVPIVVQDSSNLGSSYVPVGGFLFSYVAAAVVVAVGLLIGWAYHVPGHRQFAGNGAPATVAILHPGPEIVFVGRVTGMVDCRWTDPTTATFLYANVPLDRKYALASGVMEITYDSGAKVILEGPCTYEVESKTGGALSLGRLTAKIKKRAMKALAANHQSPLFAVRTPGAIVTDLGTEFGVETSPAGVTETHVFVGRVKIDGRGNAVNVPSQILSTGQTARLDARQGTVSLVANYKGRFIRKMPVAKAAPAPDLIARLDYSDTWSANSPTRAGSYLLLTTPESLRVENCHGNPSRSWVFSTLSAMTTWPYDRSPMPWPGFQVEGAKSGFTETGMGGTCYFGFEYGLRDDFVVQFDAVQTQDRINITIGEKPATIQGKQSLSVFFRAAGSPHPEIGVYTPSKGEVDACLGSGIRGIAQWHNYAVRFDLRQKRLTIWVDRKLRGTIDLANITRGIVKSKGKESWASLPWTARCITIGGSLEEGDGRVWTDNFRVGTPRQTATAHETDNAKSKRGE
jgi:hypothetical protein